MTRNIPRPKTHDIDRFRNLKRPKYINLSPHGQDEVCTRCGGLFRYAKHTRLHGYMCSCGNQEWKEPDTDPTPPDTNARVGSG